MNESKNNNNKKTGQEKKRKDKQLLYNLTDMNVHMMLNVQNASAHAFVLFKYGKKMMHKEMF